MEIAEKRRLKIMNVTVCIANEECLKIATESKKRSIKLAAMVKFFWIVYQLLLDVLPNHYLEATVQITLGGFER